MADGLLVLSSLLFGITFLMAVYFWLAVPHSSVTVWKHNRLKKIIHVFQVIHTALPWHYHINSSNPVYRLQLVQILSSSAMMFVGIFMHKYPQDCLVTAVLFGIAFGVNQFAGYCFLLIKAMTVDAKWRVSNLKECMRSLTSLLILLAFIIPRSIPGELNKEGECVLGTNRKRTIGLVLSGSLLDILLKIGYARLFTEPLKEVAVVQERQFGKDGKKRAEKAFSLIRTNNIISAISCLVMCIAYVIMGVGLVQENALSGYFGAYLTSFAHMIPSMISTKSAWKRKGAVGKQDTSAAEGTQPNSPTGRKSSNKQRLRKTTSNNHKPAGTGNESMDDVTSKSDDDLQPRGSTAEEKTSVTEIEMLPKSSNPDGPNPVPTPANVGEEKKLEEVKEEAEFKKPPSNPKQKTDSAGKPGTGTNRSNPRTGGSAGNGGVNKAVGRGGYGGVGASYAAGSYEIDVDLKFDSEAAEFLLDIQSLGAAIPEAEVAQHEDIAAPVSRGLFAGKDTYMDPIFSPKVAGGFGRGVAAKNGQGHARQRHSVIYRDTEVSSTKSIPNGNNTNKEEAVSPVPNASDHDISKPQTETEPKIDNV